MACLLRGLGCLLLVQGCSAFGAGGEAGSAAVRKIAEKLYIWGYPLVQNHKTMTGHVLVPGTDSYLGPLNLLKNEDKLYSPEDTLIVTPNSDTLYSLMWADVRQEPVVLTMPEVEEGRYYSLQMIDLYTHNFNYLGSRATGNGGGTYLMHSRNWEGDPTAVDGIDDVIVPDSDIVFLAYRTQVKGQEDMDQAKAVQAGYKAQLLHEYTGEQPPASRLPDPSPYVGDFKAPSAKEFFTSLKEILKYVPEVAELEMDQTKLAEAARVLAAGNEAAMEAGLQDGKDAIQQEVDRTNEEDDGVFTFGTKETYDGNWAARAAAAREGLYGNSREEAIYWFGRSDQDGQVLDASTNNYVLTLDPLPPVNSFWSVTMYDANTMLLSDNELDRYLINSPMLDDMVKTEGGGVELYLQKESPGADLESNWLPAPDGPFYTVLRAYWPKEEVLRGEWAAPAARKIGA